MALTFVNRTQELRELDAVAERGGLLVVYGRRRVGKTRLLRSWIDRRGGLYSQAIEASADLQLQQVFSDIQPGLSTRIVPGDWSELLELLTLESGKWMLCLDEFPYLTATDPTLPSRLQRWIDHSMPEGALLILSGSSTRMMSDTFLHPSAPLFGRAHKLLNVQPMDYASFCRACRLRPAEDASFEKFACVGGVPKYWEFLRPNQSPVALAESLYFDFAPYMEQEPRRILRDEGVRGLNAVAVLEAIGRGAERPSEIAARLETAQTNLSRLLNQLLEAAVLTRELPFGESVRSTRKSLYRIRDPAIRFWYRVYSPHRSRWRTYPAGKKRRLVHEHASTVFEDLIRARFPGGQRYWEKHIELDLVAPDPEREGRLLVAEVKWRHLKASERRKVEEELKSKWDRSRLRTRHPAPRFEVFDASSLAARS